jgi:ubiquinone/menaquinone biosynthesis C-methylase UbiE
VDAAKAYVLGDSQRAGRRLEIQDAHFGELSERLLDRLAIRPQDRVVELGCGAGGLSKRIMRRLGDGGVLVGVDCTEGLLNQASALLASAGPARFQPTVTDISAIGPWLDGADIVVGRAVLHHVPLAELLLGRLRTVLRPGTRIGFIEPDFRSLLGRIAFLEATGRPEVAPLRIWAGALIHLYEINRLSPDVGASLSRTLEIAGYRQVHEEWSACSSDEMMIENMIMIYDEIREQLETNAIMNSAAIAVQQRLLRELPRQNLPAAWGLYCVTCAV